MFVLRGMSRTSLFPLIQLPKKLEGFGAVIGFGSRVVSINSTSEEVRSPRSSGSNPRSSGRFPLIQLPKKLEGIARSRSNAMGISVSINSTSEEVRRGGKKQSLGLGPMFPLIQLPKKLEAVKGATKFDEVDRFH